ncbi:hypothetical protein DERF_005679 [Dermatophagoides farinae]|uniref:Uncharacterized protein n=1 Tax=Dermatophagoides farinae TaxID=6954 RepID=A0A922I4R3_DERFA|nr:hypothetical protein DERF_005679 [Dermatophagoides farinae]
MHNFVNCESCKDHEFHIAEEIQIDCHLDPKCVNEAIHDLDEIIYSKRCNNNKDKSKNMSSSSSSTITTSTTTTAAATTVPSVVVDAFQTATAQAATTLMPPTTTSTKKISNFFHYGHHNNGSGNNNNNNGITVTTTTTTTTTGTCYIKTTASSSSSTANIRANNVKIPAAAACISGIVQETITTTTFSKIHDQMAAMATADPALTMELLGASLNMNPAVADQFHNHHHHHHHHHFHNPHQSSTSKTGSCGTSPSRNNNITTSTTSTNKSQQQQRQPLTMKLKKLCNPSTTNNSNRSQEECCTKKDDCHCQACIQRQKIAEELIAEEESSKKKKQKKKKNKSNRQKKEDNKKDDDVEQEKMHDNDGEKSVIRIKKNSKSEPLKLSNVESPVTTTNITTNTTATVSEQQSTTTNKQQQSSKTSTTSKKNKKNKSNQSVETELTVAKTTLQSTVMASKEDRKSSDVNNSSSNVVNDSNGDPTSVDIQQWIKVKNKNKQQQNSGNSNTNTDWIVDDDMTIAGIDSIDNDDYFNHNYNNKDVYDSPDQNGFKVIQSDKSRKSINTNDNDSSSITQTNNNNSNNDNVGGSGGGSGGLGLGSRTSFGLNSAAAASKAKLLAIEAQIAHSNNELKGAVQYISEALEIDSKNPVYYINRAYYHERLNEFEHALSDTESALRFDECRDHLDHALCLKARCLIGLEQYEQAEQLLCRIKTLPHKPKFIPFLEKDLLLLRMKKLVSCSYTIPLARIYATRYSMIADSIAAIEQNCQILMDKKLNESDPKLHLWLINHHQQQQQNSSASTTTTTTDLLDSLNESKCLSSKTMQYFLTESQKFYTINQNDYDDDEIYFSEEDERKQWYGHPDQWNRPKDILQQLPVHFEDAKEPPNSKGQKALWIGNVSPSCSLTFVTNLFMKFGNVTFCKIFPNEQRSPDVAYLLLHYDNDISPRLVMSYFKDKIVPGISKDDNCPLLIRFRNKNDKIDDASNDSNSLPTTTSANGSNAAIAASTSGSNSPSSKTVSECYYYRTTGCDRQHCTFRHVLGNKGIDKQTWMRKKN